MAAATLGVHLVVTPPTDDAADAAVDGDVGDRDRDRDHGSDPGRDRDNDKDNGDGDRDAPCLEPASAPAARPAAGPGMRRRTGSMLNAAGGEGSGRADGISARVAGAIDPVAPPRYMYTPSLSLGGSASHRAHRDGHGLWTPLLLVAGAAAAAVVLVLVAFSAGVDVGQALAWNGGGKHYPVSAGEEGPDPDPLDKPSATTAAGTVAVGSVTFKATAATAVPVVAGPPLKPLPSAHERGLWVWSVDPCVFNQYTTAAAYAAACGGGTVASVLDTYFTMLQRPWGGQYAPYTRIFVNVDPSTLASASAAPGIRQLLRFAHTRGVAVELLQDGSTWVKSATGVAAGLALCQQVAWFNGNASDPRDVWDGVHYDIEPHTLGSGWFSNTAGGTDRYNNAWQGNLVKIFAGCRTILAHTPATVAWDVPDDYYYYVTDLWTPLMQTPYVDYLAVMTYYDDSAEVLHGVGGVGGAANVLASLKGTAGPSVLFAVEASDPVSATVGTSFWAVGAAALEATLAALTSTQPGSTGPGGFAGVAVHFDLTYGVLSSAGYGKGTAPITACNTYGSAVLFGIANSSAYVSMNLYRAVDNALLTTYDLRGTGFIPGPWQMFLKNTTGAATGPYRIELYDGANGKPRKATSPVGKATCSVMA